MGNSKSKQKQNTKTLQEAALQADVKTLSELLSKNDSSIFNQNVLQETLDILLNSEQNTSARAECVSILIKSGADISVQHTPKILNLAITVPNYKLCRDFFKCQSNKCFDLQNGGTFLLATLFKMQSYEEGKPKKLRRECYELCKIMESLLRNGRVDANCRDQNGRTPLHHVMMRPLALGSLEVTTLLIDYGADKNAEDNSGMRPIGLCKNELLERVLDNRKPGRKIATSSNAAVFFHDYEISRRLNKGNH